ncbi:adhesion G-protein coupled receptor G4-like [Corythoichthys intestinalis]|uniref:adhesion G-protein coupled receptor G4-like n=1 Tax=Corythoichthys intestinalis TaxID=161448 RepID=UPI0025A611FE|nr:adhesion G-protein coupled receptor G4-like [Corythoichthys intestinalis]
MQPKSTKRIRSMSSFHSEKRWRSVFLQVLVVFYLEASPVKAFGYFLGDTKAVLNGCEDHWTLQDSTPLPLLSQMSVCLDVRVVAPGAWVGFSYTSQHGLKPELGLEGDGGALYGWLLGVRHRFHVSLAMGRWHRVCLRRDVRGNAFSLELAGRLVAKRTVIAQAIPSSGSLWLGCRPRQRPPGTTLGRVEIYMFRVWDDLARRGACEDGNVVGWNARFWGVTSPRARQMDPHLPCAKTLELGGSSPSPSSDSRQSEAPSTTVTSSGHVGINFTSTPSSTQSIRDTKTSSSVTGFNDIPSLPHIKAPGPANGISSSTPTRDSLLTSATNILLNNFTPVSAIPPLINHTSHSTPSMTSSSAYNTKTHYRGFTHVPNDTTVNNKTKILQASSNSIFDNKVTKSSTVPPLLKYTSLYNLTTPSFTSDYNITPHKNVTLHPNDKVAYNINTNSLLPSANTQEYKVTTESTMTAFIKDMSQSQQLLPLTTTKPLTNNTIDSNLKTVTPLIKDTSQSLQLPPLTTTTPLTHDTLDSNVTTVTPFIKDTSQAKQLLPFTTTTILTNNTLVKDLTTVTPFIKDTSQSLQLPPLTITNPLTHDILKSNVTTVTPFIKNTSQASQQLPLTTPNPLTHDTLKSNITTVTPFIKDTSQANQQLSLTTTTTYTKNTLVNNLTTVTPIIKDTSQSHQLLPLTTPNPFTLNTLKSNITTVTPFIKDMSQANQKLSLTTTTTYTKNTLVNNLTTIPPFIKDTSQSHQLLPLTTPNPLTHDTLKSNITTVTPFIKDTSQANQQLSLTTTYTKNTLVNNLTTVTPINKDTSQSHQLLPLTTPNPFTHDTPKSNVTTVTPFIKDTSQANQQLSLTTTTTTYTKNTLVNNLTTVTPFIKDTSQSHQRLLLTTPNPLTHDTLNSSVITATSFIKDTSQANQQLSLTTTTTTTYTSNAFDTTLTTVTPFIKDTSHTKQLLPSSTTTIHTNNTPVNNLTTATPFIKDTSQANQQLSLTTTTTTTTYTSNTFDTTLTTVTPFIKDTSQAKQLLPSTTTTILTNNTPVNNLTTATPFIKDTSQANQQLSLTTTTTTTYTNNTFHSTLTTVTPFNQNTSQAKQLPSTTTTRLTNDTRVNNLTTVTPFVKDTSQANQQLSLTTTTTTYTKNTFDSTLTAVTPFINDTSQAKQLLQFTTTTILTNNRLVNNLTTVTTLIKNRSQTHQLKQLTTTTLTNNKWNSNSTTVTPITALIKDTPASNRSTQFSTSPDNVSTHQVHSNDTTAYVTTTLIDMIDLNVTTGTATKPLIKNTSRYNPTASSSKSFDDLRAHIHDNTFSVSTLKNSDAGMDFTTTIGGPRDLLARVLTATAVPPSQSSGTASLNGKMIKTTTSLLSGTNTKKNLEERASKLLEKTLDASQLNSSQVAQLVSELEKLLDAPTISRSLAEKIIGSVSNLMDGHPFALAASCNRLVSLVEDLSLKLLVGDVPAILSSDSLVLAVRKVDGNDFPEMSLNIFDTDDVQMNGPISARKWDSSMASVYLPSSITEGMSDEQKKQIDRVQFTFYTKPVLFQDRTMTNQTAVSPVLASSVSNMSISNLSDNIRFTIRNNRQMNANHEAVCVFWDFDVNVGAGGWSSDGCFVVSATWWGTTCSCNHLTSFAILLDLSRGGINNYRQAQILTFVTYIGCGLSSIFLAATLLTYLSFAKLLRDIPAKILVQLCFSLLLLNLAYLLNGWLARYPARGLCISTAFFLHYFLLTSFTWAGLEALHMYLSIVRVFTPYLSRYMLKFSLIGWGAPVVVVVIVISVDKDNYGLVSYGRYADGASGDFCWLRSDVAFYVGVVAYFLAVFFSCLLVFVVVMAQLWRIKKQNPHNQSPQRGLVADLRSVAGLVALLGLAWGFALFAWGPLHLPFVYLFTVFNSLQGFFVFVFHCACKENVRRQWRTYLCCGNLRLAENSEWSRTATRENRNFSAVTSARQLASRSSSLISNSTNSSSSVFADSGMSEGSGSDVILNEIHRQTTEIFDASTQ